MRIDRYLECLISTDEDSTTMKSPRAVIRRPGQKMAVAKRTGLVSLLEMIKRGKDQYPGIYKRSLKIWREAWAESQRRKKQGDFDYFIPICRVERYLRKNHHNMIFNTTALFGNTETKRVYSWDEGPIGPINALLNLAGARLRFLGMSRYPFPTPTKLNYDYTLKNGSTKRSSGYGYPSSSRNIKVILAHPTLQPLDFVDMIRALVNELCRQCFINSVPNRVASIYINLLIFRLRSFLDHIYAGKKTGLGKKIGTGDFIKKSAKILDQVLQYIQVEYGNRNGRPQRLTQRVSNEESSAKESLTLDDIKPLTGARSIYKNLKSKYGEHIDQRDLKKMAENILRDSSARGTRLHKRISWGLTHPSTERTIILGGDYYADDKSGYLLAADVPVLSGYGRVDLVLYVRQSIAVPTDNERSIGIWRPVMILDVKTKKAFECGFVGRLVKGTKKIVAETTSRKRVMSDTEWQQAIDNTPSRSEKLQVELYSNGLIADYQRLTNDESIAGSTIVSGILLVDETTYPSFVRKHLVDFVISSYERIKEDLVTSSRRHNSKSVFHIDTDNRKLQHIAIVIFPFEIPSGIQVYEAMPYPSIVDNLHKSDPFRNGIKDGRNFILYTSGGGHGAGEIASWIARYWQGIDYARLLTKKEKRKKVLWLDLANEFSNPIILKSFIRRTPPGEFTSNYLPFSWKKDRNQRRYLREFLNSESVDFHDLSHEIHAALFDGKEPLPDDELANLVSGYDMFVISGMDTLWKMVPQYLRGVLLEQSIRLAEATNIPNTTTLWFDNAIPTPETSEIYKSHRFSLIAHNSPLQAYLDKIILNVPVPPFPGIGESSFADEMRQIVELEPDKIGTPRCVEIPPLRGWSERFRSEARIETGPRGYFQKLPVSSTPSVQSVEGLVQSLDSNALLDLISTRIIRGLARIELERVTESVSVTKQKMRKPRSSGYKGVLSRIRLSDDLCNPAVIKTISKRKEQRYHDISLINSRRKYWSPKLHLESLDSVSLPPYEFQLAITKVNFGRAASIEIERILEVVSVLSRVSKSRFPLLNDFLTGIVSEVNRLQLETSGSDLAIVRELPKFFDRIGYSKSVWKTLSYYRTDLHSWNLPLGLNVELRKVQAQNRDTLLRFGNYFVMMISALLEFSPRILTHYRLQQIWNSVRPWVLIQLGANQSEKTKPDSTFNMKEIFTQLLTKIKRIPDTPNPYNPVFDEIRYGIAVDSHTQEDYPGLVNTWYVFERTPYSEDFVSGCFVEKSSTAIIPLDEQAEIAETCESSGLIRPILIGKTSGINVLYSHMDEYPYVNPDTFDYTEVDWTARGHLRYGTRQVGALARLKWLSTKYYGEFPILAVGRLPRRPESLTQRMLDHVEDIDKSMSSISRVKCELTGNDEEGQISFRELDRTLIGELNYTNTQRAIEILRGPYDVGIPIGMNRKLLTWHPVNDVSYSKDASKIRTGVVKYIDM